MEKPTCVIILVNTIYLREFAARKELMMKMIFANHLMQPILKMLILAHLLTRKTLPDGGPSVPKQMWRTVVTVKKLKPYMHF